MRIPSFLNTKFSPPSGRPGRSKSRREKLPKIPGCYSWPVGDQERPVLAINISYADIQEKNLIFAGKICVPVKHNGLICMQGYRDGL
jgi:hypothetical protein